MTSPTVTALSELKPCPFCGVALTVRASGANPRAKCSTDDCFGQKLPVVNLDVAHDVAAWNRRSALADVGECELCNGTGTVVVDYCADCNGTGKQPRPAAEVKCATCGGARMLRRVDFEGTPIDDSPCPDCSPAAHTAQVTEDIEDLVRVYGNVTYCEAKGLTHDSGKTAVEVETQLILALRRLASTAERS